MAKLFFRYGAMNSGKSTALMQVAYNYEERGMNILLLKPQIDTKGGDVVVSRLGVSRKVDILVEKDMDLQAAIKKYFTIMPIHCVLVDEVQFLSPEQVDQLFRLVIEDDVPVICYGLRTDFLMNGFAGSERLLLLAHSIEELKTICRCGRKAVFNGRKIDGRFVFEGEQVAIDGEVQYESLCGECYLHYRKEDREKVY
ncbi:MAG TPA: thymidine kinase [Tissierellia bacterium]|nr:thymidine kinase [Tissierellia bacterium]